MDIEGAILRDFGDDLWIRRRLKLGEVRKKLDELSASDAHGDHLERLADFGRFLDFLDKECGGHKFTCDKQWSELMNAMQISKKLNHQSVKFKDIIKNRPLIEANASRIRLLNRTAQIGQSIEQSLDAFEAILQASAIEPSVEQCSFGLATAAQIEATKNRLQSRTRPLNDFLCFELAQECLSADRRLAQWLERKSRLDETRSLMIQFLDRFGALESRLSNLKPMIGVELGPFDAEQSRESLESSIGECKRTFMKVEEFHRKFTESLQRLVRRVAGAPDRPMKAGSLPLSRLLNCPSSTSKAVSYSSDLYDTQLSSAIERLDECRRTLDEVMQSLCLEFGRFYFLSELELLTLIALDTRIITGQADPVKRRLISKLLGNTIDSFVLNESGELIVGVVGQSGERVLFAPHQDPVVIRKRLNLYSVEIVRVLNEVLRKLARALRELLFERLAAIKATSAGLDCSGVPDLLYNQLPLQLVGLLEQVLFCERLERELEQSGSLRATLTAYEARLSRLAGRDEAEAEQSQGSALKHSALVSLTVGFIATLSRLQADGVSSRHHWSWLSELRYYAREQEGGAQQRALEVHIGDAVFEYKFDFVPAQRKAGAFKRLIATKVTRRCLLAASQLVRLHRLGASPFGPAGSGKTETIKALGQALGCQVVVHNCDESNDAASLERLIWGLAHAGLWGCFDEFNRLQSATLSSVSETLGLVQQAIRENRLTAQLSPGDHDALLAPDAASLSSTRSVNPNCAFFITLNPATDYGGRRRLPANIRQLFPPIAMTRVELAAIAGESLLTLSAELGRLRLCCLDAHLAHSLGQSLELLMDRLRNGAAVRWCQWDLRLAMVLLARFKLLVAGAGQSGDMSAATIRRMLAHAIGAELECRLDHASQDASRLLEPHIRQALQIEAGQSLGSPSHLDHGSRETLELCEQLARLEPDEVVQKRARQLYEQLRLRSGVLLLGPARAGKSRVWRLLAEALAHQVEWAALNPASYTRKADLLGVLGRPTGDGSPGPSRWRDGALTSHVRRALERLHARPQLQQFWLLLDGPIEPDWVESLNSVLDDNQLLTLGSGERLLLCLADGRSVKLLFETNSVRHASPATLSRLGLVYCAKRGADPGEQGESGRPAIKAQSCDADWHDLARGRGERLTIIIGSDSMWAKEDERVTSYHCNSLSTSDHLADFLRQRHDDAAKDSLLLLLTNVNLIRPSALWGHRSLLEWLRYELTYGSALQRAVIRVPRASGVDCLDERLVALAGNQVLEDPSRSDDKQSEPSQEREGVALDFDSWRRSSTGPAVVCFLASRHGCGRRAELLRAFDKPRGHAGERRDSPGDVWTVHQFRSQAEASASLEALERHIRGASAETAQSHERRHLFVLAHHERRLLADGDQLMGRLLHLANWLAGERGAYARLAYLAHHQDDEVELDFWRAIGAVSRGPEVPVAEMATKRELIATEALLSKDTQLASKLASDRLLDMVRDFVLLDAFEAHFARDQRRLDACLHMTGELVARARARASEELHLLRSGLARLAALERDVGEARGQCEREAQRSGQQAHDIERLVAELERTLEGARQSRDEAGAARARLAALRAECEQRRAQVERELREARPRLEANRRQVLAQLKPEALNEIRTLRAPPKTIKDILDVLFALLGVEGAGVGEGASSGSGSAGADWASMKAYLARTSLRDQLASFDMEQRRGPAELIDRVEAMRAERAASFRPDQVARASRAAPPLVGWIEATLVYGRALARVAPLSAQVEAIAAETRRLEEEARQADAQQAHAEKALAQQQARLDGRRDELAATLERSRALGERLERAQQLIGSLRGQADRWRGRARELEARLDERSGRASRVCALVGALACLEGDAQLRARAEQRFGLAGVPEHELVAEACAALGAFWARSGAPELGRYERADSARSQPSQDLDLETLLALACIALGRHLVPLLELGGRVSPETIRDRLGGLAHRLVEADELLGTGEPPADAPFGERARVTLVRLRAQASALDILGRARELLGSGRGCALALVLSAPPRPRTGPEAPGGPAPSDAPLRDATRTFVRRIQLSAPASASAAQQRALRRRLLGELVEPALGESLGELAGRLHELRERRQLAEVSLLERLASVSPGDRSSPVVVVVGRRQTTPDAHEAPKEHPHQQQQQHHQQFDEPEALLDERLVGALRALELSERRLDEDERQLGEQLAELSARDAAHERFLARAVHFYAEHVAPLAREDAYYALEADQYARVLVRECACDLARLASRLAAAMRPEARQAFFARLAEQQVADERQLLAARPTLASLWDWTMSGGGGGQDDRRIEDTGPGPCLAVVLHDAHKASPQLEIDELFGRAPRKLSYRKVFAGSSDSSAASRLAAKIRDSLEGNASDSAASVCCLANAHLAGPQLAALLEEAAPPRGAARRRLLVLVAESERPGDFGQLDWALVERARWRFWYDGELASERPKARLELAERTLDELGAPIGDARTRRRLAALHSLCQARCDEGAPERFERGHAYLFDGQQLRLAAETARRALASGRSGELGARLEALVYGPRMETLADERALHELVERVFAGPD